MGRLTFLCLPPLDGPCDCMIKHLVLLNLTKCLRARTDQLHIPTIQIEHVRTWVDLPQLSIRIERMQLRGFGESLGRHGLDNVPREDMLLQIRHERLVSCFPHVRFRLGAGGASWDGWLGDFGWSRA